MAAQRKPRMHGNTNPRRTKQFAKKTRTNIKHQAYPNPPGGFMFVPKGDVYVTRKCTTLTRESGQEVHIVHDQKSTRIGIHVPKHVWKKALAAAAQTAEKRGEAVCRKDERDTAKAKAMLQKAYPNMPCSDLEKVLNHAFLKGSGRVGRTGGQGAEQRASLAVGAHIRHNYTAYEDMLNRGGMNREQARDLVWKTVRDVKLSWAGKVSNVLGKTSSDV